MLMIAFPILDEWKVIGKKIFWILMNLIYLLLNTVCLKSIDNGYIFVMHMDNWKLINGSL